MTDLAPAFESLVPPFDDSDADWRDVLRRGAAEPRPRRRALVAALATSAAVAAVLAATPLGHAIVSSTLDHWSAWVGISPGQPAPAEEQRLLQEANARAAAPIPADTELGLLASKSLNGVDFELLGFRDRASLCLRLRSSAGEGGRIVKAPASCVSEELLIDLGKPVAVVSAADPFPRRAKSGLQALYGLAADGVAIVELETKGGIRRVPVENNAFLYLYEGEGPRLTASRLDYRSDIPSRAIGLDAKGHEVGSVEIMSLARGYPGGLPAEKLPGPAVVEHPIASPRIGWLDRGESRGDPYEWRLPDGSTLPGLDNLRTFRPNPDTSMRVAVGRTTLSGAGAYCTTNVWPLQLRPTGMMCDPVGGPSGTITLAAATTIFDAQFPVYYGLVPDGISSLELVLANGAVIKVPVTDNVFAFQAWSPQPAKLVGYDEQDRVALIRVVSF